MLKYILLILTLSLLFNRISSTNSSHLFDFHQINPKFRRDPTSPVNQTNSDSTTMSPSLFQLLSPKPKVRDRISFANYYFERQLRAFFSHHHAKFPAPTPSNIKTALR